MSDTSPLNHGRNAPFEPLAWAAGAFAGALYVPAPEAVFALAACACAAAGIVALGRPGTPSRLRGVLLVACAFGLAFGLSARRAETGRKVGAGFGLPDATVARAEGVLVRDSAPIAGGTRYAIELDACADRAGASAGARGRLAVILKPEGLPMEAGTRVVVRGRIVPDQAGDGWIAFGATIEPIAPPAGIAGFRARAFRAAERAVGRIGTVSTPLLKALLLGVRDDLDEGTREVFKRAGCAHVLALSGQHLSALAILVVAALSPILGSFPTLAVATFVVCGYTALVGADASILRGALMFALMAIGKLRGRPCGARNALAASFILQAAIFPESAYGWSFILSYLAMVGLVFLSPAFDYALKARVGPALSTAFAASFAAQAATAPFCAIAFGGAYPGGILTSTVAGPVSALFLWIGAVGTAVVCVAPFLRTPVTWIADLSWRALMLVLEGGAAMPPVGCADAGAQAAVIAACALGTAFVCAWPRIRGRTVRLDLAKLHR